MPQLAEVASRITSRGFARFGLAAGNGFGSVAGLFGS